jgi:site-specific DNA-methyltransferase (adenine-specific)
MPKRAFLDLVSSGQLVVGTKLHHPARIHTDRSVTASVVTDGMRMGGRNFATPSAAAKEVTGKPVDGWLFWKLPDGRSLDSLRRVD